MATFLYIFESPRFKEYFCIISEEFQSLTLWNLYFIKFSSFNFVLERAKSVHTSYVFLWISYIYRTVPSFVSLNHCLYLLSIELSLLRIYFIPFAWNNLQTFLLYFSNGKEFKYIISFAWVWYFKLVCILYWIEQVYWHDIFCVFLSL